MTAVALLMDSYGFVLSGLTDADHASRQKVLTKDKKVAKEWDPRALPTWQPRSSPSEVPRKLKLLVRKGIPRELRPKLWLQFSGGLAVRSEGRYEQLLAATPKLPRSSQLQLNAAIAKSFPGLSLLSTPAGNDAVQRLTAAYSQHTEKAALLGNSDLNCLAAFLLAVMGVDREEDAFWTLVGLVETRLSSLALLQGEAYSRLETKVLEAIAAKKCPKLASLLGLLDISFQQLMHNWLPTLFTKCLPAEAAARVWDVLMVEESPACFSIGAALIKMHEPTLVTSCRSGLIERSLTWRIAHTFDADAIFKEAFGMLRPLVGLDELAAARASAQRKFEADMAARQARLGSLFRQPSFPPMFLPEAEIHRLFDVNRLTARARHRLPPAKDSSRASNSAGASASGSAKAQRASASPPGEDERLDGNATHTGGSVAEKAAMEKQGDRKGLAMSRVHSSQGFARAEPPPVGRSLASRLVDSTNSGSGSTQKQQAVAMFF